MLEIVFRTIIIYFALLIFMRIMGKREIGQLSLFDFVVSIVIAELAAIPMESQEIPIINGLLPIAILAILQITLSFLCLKSNKFRKIIYGQANILIANGKLNKKEMRKARYNIDDLLTQLREKDVFNMADVEYAVLETSGQLSVSLKPQKRPLTPADLDIRTEYEGMPIVLIDDKEINFEGLRDKGLTKEWLEVELKKRYINSLDDVFFASLNANGEIYIVENEK